MSETDSNHVHHCPKCKEYYLGYNPLCKEPPDLPCGPCTAKEFQHA